MWIQEFLTLFPNATEQVTGKRQDLGGIERQLVRARNTLEVTSADLRVVEESNDWAYAKWWPPLSSGLQGSFKLPENLGQRRSRREAVQVLYEKVRDIEVASVILRFVCPRYFGIISPPVMHLLNLTPKESIETYLTYTEILQTLADHYRMERVADIDMALWTAAQLYISPLYAELTKQMNGDAFFQETRLRNLVANLRLESGVSDRLLFAKVLLDHEHVIAGVIAARAFEDLCRKIAIRLTIPDSKFGYDLVRKIESPRNLRALGITRGDVSEPFRLRNDAVHGDISHREARQLVELVERLHVAVSH
ncbi:MAG: hypothetical protein HYR72_21600 [Deltaproteobacteria bacterium]|nr:hypothetical protein [Deltaproteobacteria bacterium]MBI3390113.1 hypothetical protein [Deltaproteobacteria bacterium]